MTSNNTKTAIELKKIIHSAKDENVQVDPNSMPKTHTLPSFIRCLEFIIHSASAITVKYYDPITCHELKFELDNPDEVISQMPPQTHNFYELYYIISGELRIEIQEESHLFQAGDCLLMDLITKSRTSFSEDLHFFALSLSPAFLHSWPISFEKKTIYSQVSFRFFERTDPSSNRRIGEYIEYICKNNNSSEFSQNAGELQDLFTAIIHEIQQKQTGYSFIIYGIIARIFTCIENDTIYAIHEHNTLLYEDMNVAEQVDYYLLTHKRHVTITELSNFLHYNPAYLSRIYKKKKGTSIQETNQKIYLEEARHLLADTDIKLEKIVQTLGFSNRTNFNTLFKSHFDCLPLAYRMKEHGKRVQ